MTAPFKAVREPPRFGVFRRRACTVDIRRPAAITLLRADDRNLSDGPGENQIL